MRSAFRVVFLFLALLASEAFAQQLVVFSVDGWPRMSTRQDGKIVANSFSWGVSATAPGASGVGASSGKPGVQDSILTFPIGDAALFFARAALRSDHLQTVLVEFPLAKANPGSPAPFAARLSDVTVTGVNLSKAGDGGPGVAEVKFNAARIEFFTSTQDPSGAMRPGAKIGFDTKAMKVY